MTVATRTDVGTCDLGNVFIFARTSSDGDSWMVRAGNHTIGTYDSESGAEAVARALVGTNVTNEFVAAEPEPVAEPEPEPEYVAPTRAAVSKMKGK